MKKDGISFKQWCEENNKEFLLDMWDYDNNIVSPDAISKGTHNKFLFRCCDNKNHQSKAISLDKVTQQKTYGSRFFKCIECNSFSQWCIDNDRTDLLDRWDYELNDKKPTEVTYKSNLKYWFKCPCGKHESELSDIQYVTSGRNNTIPCKKCNSFAQWCIDNFGEDHLNKIWRKENKKSPWEVSFRSRYRATFQCLKNEKHIYQQTLSHYVDKPGSCAYCQKIKVHRNESVGFIYPETIDLWSDKNKKTPYDYSQQSSKKVWLKCKNNKHEDYYTVLYSAVNHNFRCPQCSKIKTNSELERKVFDYCSKQLGYDIVTENNCSISPINPITKSKMFYDNEIAVNNDKLIIEVHGEQHYKITGFHKMKSDHNFKTNGIESSPEDFFKDQQYRDKYKKDYAISHGYYYLEIPYWTEKDEKYKELIDNKIEEILSKQSNQKISQNN